MSRSTRRAAVTVYVYAQPEGPECEGHELDEIEVEVEGTVSAYIAANFRGHPDNWSPAEGGDVEIVSAKANGQAFELGSELEEKAIEALEEKAINEAEEDEGPEYEYEPRDFDDYATGEY